MKTIAGILALVMLVTGVAVSGSRAQPLPGSSVAFQQCMEQASPLGDRCGSAVSLVAGIDEVGGDRAMDQAGYGDLGQAQGGDLSSPEFWRELLTVVVVYVAEQLAQWAYDRYFGGSAAADLMTAHAASEIFDPVK